MFSLPVGGGIELRLMEKRHAERFFALINQNREHLRKWLPWVDATWSPEDVQGFVHRALEQFAEDRGLHAGIWLRGELAGAIGCHPIDWSNRATSIGYWLGAPFQGKGVITQCCRAIVSYLLDEMSLHRVEIRCATQNTRSCAVPERLGFVREGVIREAQWVAGGFVDLAVYGILASEWRAKASK